MIKIQDVIDFIGSKRPQYRMENWKDLNQEELGFLPIKDENGKLGYYNEKNKKEGYWEKYYNNGQIQSKGLFIDGKKDGYWEQYYEDGNIMYKGNYVNDKEDGYCELYYPNGKLFVKGNYINGNFYEE